VNREEEINEDIVLFGKALGWSNGLCLVELLFLILLLRCVFGIEAATSVRVA